MFYLFLLALVIISVGYGVVTQQIGWVVGGMAGMAVAASGLLRLKQDSDRVRISRLLQRYVGAHWQVLICLALSLAMVSGALVYYAPLNRLSMVVWAAALLLLLAAVWVQAQLTPWRWFQQSWQRTFTHPHWNRFDWAVVLLLLLVAAALRLYRLDETFPPAREDEGFQALFTLQALYGFQANSGYEPIAPFSVGWFGHPTLFYFIQAGAMTLFGENLMGLRILAALVGAACPPTLYFLGKQGWGRLAGISAGWLLAISHFHLQYSRLALQNIETVWLMILLACCLVMIYREQQKNEGSNKRASWLILTGVVIGLNQYFYVGARFAFLLTAALLLPLLLQRKIAVRHLALLALVVTIVLLPQLVFYAKYPEHLTVRSQGVSIFSEENVDRILGPEATLQHDWRRLIAKQAQAHWHFWFDHGDTSPFYWAGTPAFDAITVALFWLGLGILLIRFYHYPYRLAAFWWGLGVFFAGIFTLNPTWGARLVVIAPSVTLIAGLFVQEVLTVLYAVWPQNTRQMSALVFGSVVLSVTFYTNFNIYFEEYALERPGLDTITVAQAMAEHADAVSYLLGTSTDVNQGVIRFVARQTETYNMPPLTALDELLVHHPPEKSLLFVAQPPREAELNQIEQRLPNGVRQTYLDPKGNLALITYALPAALQSKVGAPESNEAATGSISPLSPPR